MKVFTTKNAEETQQIAQKFGKEIKNGKVIVLYGDLGSGKTTFVQGLAKGLGITQRIISPTFVIMRSYRISSHLLSSRAKRGDLSNKEIASPAKPDRNDGSRQDGYHTVARQARTVNFYHIDLYRTESQKDILELGIKEIISDPQNIVVIEWAEKLGYLLPKNAIKIYFEYVDENSRKIQITNILV